MKPTYLILSVVSIGWGCLACETAYAQRTNQSRTSTSTGSTIPGGSFSSSNFGQTGSNFGQSGSATGFNQTQQTGPIGTRNTNQGLVGTNNFGQAQGTGGGRNANRRGGGGNQQNFGPGMNQFGQQSFGQNQQVPTPRTIQPQHRIAFNYATPTATNVAGKIERILAPHSKAKVQIRNLKIEPGENGIVTLRGEVDSEEYKTLAGLMVQFEPGVRKVQNELVIHSQAD